MKYGLFVTGPLYKRTDLINDPLHKPSHGWYKRTILTEIPENIDTVLEEIKTIVEDPTLWKIDEFKDPPLWKIDKFTVKKEFRPSRSYINVTSEGYEGIFVYVNVSIDDEKVTKKWRISYDYEKIMTLIFRNYYEVIDNNYRDYTENLEDINEISSYSYFPFERKFRIKSTPYTEYKLPK